MRAEVLRPGARHDAPVVTGDDVGRRLDEVGRPEAVCRQKGGQVDEHPIGLFFEAGGVEPSARMPSSPDTKSSSVCAGTRAVWL